MASPRLPPFAPFDQAAELRTVTLWFCKACGRGFDEERMARHCHAADYPCMHKECAKRSRYAYQACEDCRERYSLERWEKMPVVAWDGVRLLYSQTRNDYYDEVPFLPDCEASSFDELRLVLCDPVKARMFDVREWIHDDISDEDESTGNDKEAERIETLVNTYLEGLTPLSWTPGNVRPDTSSWTVVDGDKGE